MYNKAVIASYEVAQLIAQKWKSHSIGETLINLDYRIMMKCMLSEIVESKMYKIPLSNYKSQRIIDMSVNISENV